MSDRPMADATRQIARPSQGGRVSPSLRPPPPAGVEREIRVYGRTIEEILHALDYHDLHHPHLSRENLP